MSQWKNTKINASVLVPQLLGGPAVAIGAVYCAERFSPRQMSGVKKIIAEHLVLPHLKFFESLGGGIRRAQEKYDQKKMADQRARGEKVDDVPKPLPAERAHTIADILVTSAVAFIADVGATLLLQTAFKKALSADMRPLRTTFVESMVQLGCTAAMIAPGIARGSEYLNHAIIRKGILQNTFGMKKEQAEDISVPFTYVALPGLFATLYSLYDAHKNPGQCKR